MTGSRVPLYLNGHRLDELYALSIPVDGRRSSVRPVVTSRG
ncbi:hypothetical protein H7J54_04775 [Mycolicibacter arupensis]|nr:hypothetical protein [Mycolicibacter arupensis]